MNTGALFTPLLAFSLFTGTTAADTRSPADINRPPIGTEEYSAGCVITESYEDGSAVAYCPEDGATYHFDPDGEAVSGRPIGWYIPE